MDWLLVTSALLGAAGLLIGLGLLIARVRRATARRYGLRSLPPLIIPAGDQSLPAAAARVALTGSASGWGDRQLARHVMHDGAVGTAVRRPPPTVREAWSDGGRSDGRSGDGDGVVPDAPSLAGLDANGEVELPVETARTVRVQRPMEETLQFLPGRLEIAEGEDRGQTIRFVRLFGEAPVVTFGRSAGPPHRHVQLRSLTVSRVQARMRYEGRRWQVTNLSETNPTLVNGQELSMHATRTLEHGDRIEMGEVVFHFWEY